MQSGQMGPPLGSLAGHDPASVSEAHIFLVPSCYENPLHLPRQARNSNLEDEGNSHFKLGKEGERVGFAGTAQVDSTSCRTPIATRSGR